MKKSAIRIFQLFILLVIRIKYLGRVKVQYGDLSKIRGPVVIAANHANELDPFIIACFLPLRVIFRIFPYSFMTANIYYYRWWKPFAFLAGCYPAKPRGEFSKAESYGVEASVRLLKQGYSVLMFPEGKRTRHPIEAKSGISRILHGIKNRLVLCHIDWSKRQDGISFVMTVDAASKELDRDNPQQILDAVYELPLNDLTFKAAEAAKRVP